jgi:pilus assembly protein Flp/PilA
MIMRFAPQERGQGMVEYALIIALIALVLIILITVMGTQVSILYSEINAAFP